ncbi:MAG: hypothetical protein AAGL24_09320 [Pseudomonadota bacterium]
MSSAFYIYPEADAPFDADGLRSRFLRAPHVRPDPTDSLGILIGRDASEAEIAAEALEQDPDTPQWVVFIRFAPEEIVVYRDALRPTLDAARPLIDTILAAGFDRIEDDESRPIELPGGVEPAEILLYS